MNILDEYGGQLLDAFATTIELALSSALLAVLLGIVLAGMRVSPIATLRTAGTWYVEIVRNTPLTLIILFCSFGLSQTLGITLVDSQSATSITDSAFRLSILGLGAYTATFVCEVLRAGINTVPIGQSEASRALGFTFMQSLRIVVLPQAMRSVIAPLGSIFIALTKNSTIASAIGVAEASLLMKEMIENTASLIVVGTIIATGFLVLTIPSGLLFGFLANRFAVKS
jgi:glutamate transport system permease protein